MKRKTWVIYGRDRDKMYRVSTVEEVDAIIAAMMATPAEERGEKFMDEIDCLLDGRKVVEEGQ